MFVLDSERVSVSVVTKAAAALSLNLAKSSRPCLSKKFCGRGFFLANNVIDWVKEFDHKIPTIEKLVLYMIADDSNRMGTSHYLGSMKRIAKLCAISERRARTACRWLEEAGLILTTSQFRENGSFTANSYQCRITIEPENWTAPDGMGKSTSAIMSTVDEGRFYEILAGLVQPQTFEIWIKPTQVVTYEKKKARLVIKAPNNAFITFLREHTGLLLEAAQQVDPEIQKLHFILPNFQTPEL